MRFQAISTENLKTSVPQELSCRLDLAAPEPKSSNPLAAPTQSLNPERPWAFTGGVALRTGSKSSGGFQSSAQVPENLLVLRKWPLVLEKRPFLLTSAPSHVHLVIGLRNVLSG